MFGISISNLYFSKCLKWVEVWKMSVWHTILPSNCFREVEANPLKMKGPISGHVKIRTLGSLFIFTAPFWMALME